MNKDDLLGAWGETLAAQYLRKKWYRIVAANYRCRFGEIDLIAKNRRYLVFVEVKLRKNEYFIADLIGLAVVDEQENVLGTLTDVLATGANDVYIVTKDGKELLIPAIRQCILDVDLETGVMKVHLLEGLQD